MTALLARIRIYPIKSLDGLEVQQAEILPSGALRHDRRYAVVDEQGKFINGKRTPLVHRVRARFNLDRESAQLQCGGETGGGHLNGSRDELAAALSRWVEQPVRIVEDRESGFPDDRESPGPTVVSTPTLRTVAEWFPGLAEEEVRRRFRANLELDGVSAGELPAFWEDRLYSHAGEAIRFRIGSVVLAGTNPCQRCIVPTRDATTGETWLRFVKAFAARREEALPAWAERSRFDHFYRLAVNTRVVASGMIRVGDTMEVL
jgi:uncharacterized protein YcbX